VNQQDLEFFLQALCCSGVLIAIAATADAVMRTKLTWNDLLSTSDDAAGFTSLHSLSVLMLSSTSEDTRLMSASGSRPRLGERPGGGQQAGSKSR
jgi:hypothetical protein